MVADFLLSVLRYGYIVLLWVFVLSTVALLRRDIFGFSKKLRPQKPALAANSQKSPESEATEVLPRDDSLPPSVAKEPTINRIVIAAGSLKGTVIGVNELEEGDQFTIGRLGDLDISIDDDYLSSMHARIFKVDGNFFIEDLNSTNGTLLNMIKLNKPKRLKIGDEIQIGLNVLKVES